MGDYNPWATGSADLHFQYQLRSFSRSLTECEIESYPIMVAGTLEMGLPETGVVLIVASFLIFEFERYLS